VPDTHILDLLVRDIDRNMFSPALNFHNNV